MKLSRIICVLALSTTLALVVVWQSKLVARAGHDVQGLRGAFRREKAVGEIYRLQVTQLRSPRRIVKLVDELALELVQEPLPETRAADRLSATAGEGSGNIATTQ